jgi:hypothetical protein
MRHVSFRKRLPLTLALPLFVLACSQVGYESYGCTCASRTYSTTEIEEYRRDAAKGDQKAIAEMQEYYMWREDPVQQMSYLVRRFPAISEDNARNLLSSAVYIAKEDFVPIAERRAMLVKLRAAMTGIERRPTTLWSKTERYFQKDDIGFSMSRAEDIDALLFLDNVIDQFDGEIAARRARASSVGD